MPHGKVEARSRWFDRAVARRFFPSQRVRDWLLAYDPAQANLRLACRVLLSVVLALGLIILFGHLTGYPVMSLSLAVILAMNTSSAARDPRPLARRVTMLLTPLPAGLAVTLAAVLNGRPLGGEIGFVLVACVSVYIRRFGPRGFTFGMVGFMSYFFALFTHVQPAALPWVYAALVVGALCSLVSYVLVPDLSLERTLSAALEALRGRLRQYMAACIAALRSGADGNRREVQRSEMQRAEVRLGETTLAASEGANAFSEASGAVELTAHLLDLELSARRLGRVSLDLPAEEREVALRDLERLLHWTLAGRGGQPWATDTRTPAQLRPALGALTNALNELRTFDLGRLEPRTDKALPGPTPATPAGLRLTTRQALQAALACTLAIMGGELISPSRWYWAVITAFIVFTGTSTRGEVFVRSWLRVLGTFAGVAVGVLLAILLHGNLLLSLVLILLSVFLGFYLIRLSYALMIFHITVTLALFYGLTGTFSPGLLELRLIETAYGALAGALASAFLLPTQTRGQLQLETRAYLRALAGLFGDLAAQVRAGKPMSGTWALILARQFGLLRGAARPLLRNPFRGSWRESVAYRLQLLGALEYEVEGLLQFLRTWPAGTDAAGTTPPCAPPKEAIVVRLQALQRHCEALAEGRTSPDPLSAQFVSDEVEHGEGTCTEFLLRLERIEDRLNRLEPKDPLAARQRLSPLPG